MELEDKYQELLEKVQATKSHHPLWPMASRGCSMINMAYLSKIWLDDSLEAIQAVDVQTIDNEATSEVLQIAEDQEKLHRLTMEHASDDKLPREIRAVYKSQNALHSKRAQLSNSLHTASTDDQRAQISKKIQDVQKQIIKNRAIWRAWKHHRIIPENTSDVVPGLDEKNAFAVFSKRDSLKSSITRFRSEIKKLENLPQSDPEKEKIGLIEIKLQNHEIWLNHVKSLIKESLQAH